MLQVLLDAPTLPQPDTAPLMREIARVMETSVLLNFTQQRQPDGIPWLPSKRAQKDGGKTLIDTGASCWHRLRRGLARILPKWALFMAICRAGCISACRKIIYPRAISWVFARKMKTRFCG